MTVFNVLMVISLVGFIISVIAITCIYDKVMIISLIVAGIAFIAGIVWGIFFIPKDIEPTALDVYRGKTTLEITYRDSVAVDSVVVYKVR